MTDRCSHIVVEVREGGQEEDGQVSRGRDSGGRERHKTGSLVEESQKND